VAGGNYVLSPETNLWKRLSFPSLVLSGYKNCRCASSNFLEEFVPADLFQAFFLWAEIDTENAGVPTLSGLFDGRGRPPRSSTHFLILLWSVVVWLSLILGNSELGLVPS
jgi:hypothetical protein